MNFLRNQTRNIINRREEQKIKRDVNPIYLETPTRESLQQQAGFYGELILEDFARINGNMKYRTIQKDYPLLKVLLTRIIAINDLLQQALSDIDKTKEEKENEINFKKRLRANKQDFEKWKNALFGGLEY